MKKFVIPIALFSLLGLLLGYAIREMQTGEYSPRDIPSPLIGKPLPSFALPSLMDPKRTVTTADLRGRVYLLNVWASWCVACREEHPRLVALSRERRVPIIGLNYKDERNDALGWLRDFGDPYELSIADRDGRVGIDLGVYGVPETFLIDKAGVIRQKQIGPITEKAWNDKLLPLIERLSNENAPAPTG
jgi:cytochrome c biogenesis protein CcmG, thiol:disulfide interchange protein DsbE